MHHFRTTIDSPIGVLTVVATDAAIVAIHFGDEPVGGAQDGDGHPLVERAVGQLAEYFAGERTDFDLPLAANGTPFQRSAWDALRRIPYGETVSYGEQAAMLGDRKKSRAVGAANGRNPIPIVVPCHRVVGTNGHLTGFAGGVATKAWLLDHERSVRATP